MVSADSSFILPPGPKRHPIFGNMIEFQRDSLGYLTYLQQTYGDVVSFHLENTPIILLSRPEHVRYILIENARNFTQRETMNDLYEITGDGLFTIEGETHRQQRRLVQPAFHKKYIESYANIMVEYTSEMLDSWHADMKCNIGNLLQNLTIRIIAKCLFSIELGCQISDLSKFFTKLLQNTPTAFEHLLGQRLDLPFTAYGRRMRSKRNIDAIIYNMIAQRRAEGGEREDLLSMLLAADDNSDMLTTKQIRDHMMTFWGAGHEATSVSLIWTFYLLSRYPKVREKLLAELQTVLGNRVPTLEDIPNLPYTEWVMNESMRLYSPSWVSGRRSIAEFDLDGYHFPAGYFFAMSQWVIHRHPDIWEDANTFKPERWNPVHGQKVPQWSYFPFGAGPRICIGMPFAQLEIKLVLATILQRYVPELVPGYQPKMQPTVTLRPKNGLPVVLKPAPVPVELCAMRQ